jgi:hypothetical protein
LAKKKSLHTWQYEDNLGKLSDTIERHKLNEDYSDALEVEADAII